MISDFSIYDSLRVSHAVKILWPEKCLSLLKLHFCRFKSRLNTKLSTSQPVLLELELEEHFGF